MTWSPAFTSRARYALKARIFTTQDLDTTWLRKQVGMVFQKANPFPMSIYDNVAYGPRTHGIRNQARSWTRS